MSSFEPSWAGAGGGSTVTEFYIDWNDLSVIPESQNTTSATLAINTRKDIAFSSVTTPAGDTLDNYDVIQVQAELYYSTDGKWHNSNDYVYTTVGVGCTAVIYDGATICLASGSGQLWSRSRLAGSSNGSLTGNTTARPCRIRITASK